MAKIKPMYVGLVTAATLLLGACTHQAQEPTSDTPAASAPEESFMNEDTPNETPASTFTLAEVATHNTPEDCWLVIEGKVYNVSNFADNHGGGEAVYQGCGKDATELFNTRPMGSKTPHSDTARSFLPNFYMGDLAQ